MSSLPSTSTHDALLPHVRSDILASFINVHKLLECPANVSLSRGKRDTELLDDIHVVLEVNHHILTARMQTVVQQRQSFEHMAPVLALVVQPLIEHLHNLDEFVPDQTDQLRQTHSRQRTGCKSSGRSHSSASRMVPRDRSM